MSEHFNKLDARLFVEATVRARNRLADAALTLPPSERASHHAAMLALSALAAEFFPAKDVSAPLRKP